MQVITLQSIKDSVSENALLSNVNKAILLDLINAVEPEIAALAIEKTEHALLIGEFVENSTFEAMQPVPDKGLLKLSLEGLSASVIGFETTHPELVKGVSNISEALLNLGI